MWLHIDISYFLSFATALNLVDGVRRDPVFMHLDVVGLKTSSIFCNHASEIHSLMIAVFLLNRVLPLILDPVSKCVLIQIGVSVLLTDMFPALV